MHDKFASALEDVCTAVGSGETIEQAVRDAAEEHDLPEAALMNRAVRKIGNLDHFRKTAEEIRIRSRIEAINRRDFWSRGTDSEMALYQARNDLRDEGSDMHKILNEISEKRKNKID